MHLEQDTVQPNHGLYLRYAHMTDPGGRATNEDALRCMQQDDLYCFVVSDGVGADAGGDVASGLVVDSIIGRFCKEACVGARALRSYIDWAAVAVTQRQAIDRQLCEMKSTVAAVLIDSRNGSAAWGHLGDTRIYLFRNRKLHKVTRDHSLVQQLVDAGYCHVTASRTHPQRNALYGAIGESGSVGTDIVVEEMAVTAGDVLLICSDGFWEWITEAEMEDLVASTDSPARWLTAMRHVIEKNAASTTHPRDNCTAIAIVLDAALQQSGPSNSPILPGA